MTRFLGQNLTRTQSGCLNNGCQTSGLLPCKMRSCMSSSTSQELVSFHITPTSCMTRISEVTSKRMAQFCMCFAMRSWTAALMKIVKRLQQSVIFIGTHIPASTSPPFAQTCSLGTGRRSRGVLFMSEILVQLCCLCGSCTWIQRISPISASK